ncbi:threonine synthase [Streptomyces sp. NPDC004752]
MEPVAGARGAAAWRQALPVPGSAPFVSLGEGDTPLLPLDRLGADLGVGRLLLKDESRNPTWSWKDRLAVTGISRAAADGAETVVVATTGNHGAAVAAHAAAAGLRCVALTLTEVPVTMLTLMQVYGAEVVAYEHGPDRWRVMAEAVHAHGWVPMSGHWDPPIGSNPFGVDGYKVIAFELWRDLGAVPDVVVAPAAYADGLAGMYRGFADLVALGCADRFPRIVAAEVFGPYSHALAHGVDQVGPVSAGASKAFSISGSFGTFQGLDAIRRTAGTAVAVGDDQEIMTMQARFASTEGLYQEAAGITPLAAVARLVTEGKVGRGDTVVVVGTSTGLKDPGSTAERLPKPPVLEPTLTALDAALSGVAR